VGFKERSTVHVKRGVQDQDDAMTAEIFYYSDYKHYLTLKNDEDE